MTMTISEQATAAPAVEVPEGLPRPTRRGYVPERVLGQSPRGAVPLARGGVSGPPVVVRVLPDRVGDDPVLRDRFLAAAERACRLSHPNVVRLFEQADHAHTADIVVSDGGKQLMFTYTSTTLRAGSTGPYVGLTAWGRRM